MTTLNLPRRALFALAALTLLGLGLGGCVNQGSYDNLYETNASLRDQNQRLLDENGALKSANEQLQARVAAGDRTIAELRQLVGDLQSRLSAANDELASLGKRIGEIKLDPATDRALAELAAQYPDLIEYDAERGMLRFKTDLLFASGSDEVNEGARRGIDALAKILLSPAAQQYDTRVVGHTDSQRISANTAKRFPSNVHLSAGRAISVRAELVKMGVPAPKVEVAGWGEFRPLVPNSANGNTPQNRRVEIYLVRGVPGGIDVPAPAPGPAAAPAKRGGNEDFLK
ncbi:MAG: OmpA family protein [Phycisphaerae bacterium]|nr:OmpA family protein [Phycisphaerae bacterium]